MIPQNWHAIPLIFCCAWMKRYTKLQMLGEFGPSISGEEFLCGRTVIDLNGWISFRRRESRSASGHYCLASCSGWEGDDGAKFGNVPCSSFHRSEGSHAELTCKGSRELNRRLNLISQNEENSGEQKINLRSKELREIAKLLFLVGAIFEICCCV